VKIAGMKAENNLSRSRLKHCAFLTDLPTPTKSPLIERKSGLRRITALGIFSDRLGGSEVFCPTVSDVGFRRTDIRIVGSGFRTGSRYTDCA
jgi:hypothetical protein